MRKGQGKKNIQVEENGIRSIVNSNRQHIQDEIYQKLTLCINQGQDISPNQFARKWLNHNSTTRTNNILAGLTDFDQNHGVDMSKSNPNYHIANAKLFTQNKWNYKIMTKFSANALSKDGDTIHLLAYMLTILQGYFSQADSSMITKVIHLEHLGPLQAFFYTKTDRNITLFWEVGIDKIPKISRFSKSVQSELQGYDYIHTITFIDCRYDVNIDNNAGKIITPYYQDQQHAIHRQDYQSVITSTNHYQLKKGQHSDLLFVIEANDLGSMHGELQYRNRQSEIVKWLPHTFPTVYLTKQEQKSFVYDDSLQRWVSKDYEAIQQARQMREYQAKINKDLLRRYADFSSAARLVDLLQRVPNFKIKLTEEEQKVVGSDGNVMVIGRSGTGKTTCSILRLFAMETLFKLRLELYKQKHENVLQNYKYDDQEVNNNVGLHCVFATASPVLTTEVKRYYGKLTAQIKAELEKKKQKDRLKRQQEEQEAQKQQIDNQFNQSTVQFVDAKQVEENYFEQQIGGIQLQKEQGAFQEDLNEEDWDQEEEKLKQELNAFHSFADMKDSDFPAFLTIKKLVLLIDGSIAKPFFSRTQDNKVVSSDTHAQWSTEKTGVIFINTYKQDQDQEVEYDEEDYEALFEDDELNVDNMDEQQLEEEYQRQLYLMNKPQLQANVESSKSKLSQEVDFDFFIDKFWYSKYNKYQNGNLNPSFVWTQIYSHIKGAAACHTYPGHYMPKRVYLRLNKNDELFEDIFECYILYERWKIQQGYYDFMDVVNHILVQLVYGRCNLIPIHYLMIDECQDLPHAVLLLLCKITEQGLFFSGDTAQNIAKGVGFRFQDLKSLFKKPEISYNAKQNDLTIHQLTINFRSHNNILQLANCLVSLLEIFFPNTIDKLKKERSNISGPKPIIVNGDKEELFYLLSGETADQKQQVGERLPIEFGCNQVVLVKDQESKKNIPTILQHALVLTIYEAKGLEFDDVILYNFFQDHFIGDSQWKLLQTCEIIDEEMSKEKFKDGCTQHKTLDDEATIFTGFEQKNGNVVVKRIVTQQKFYDELTYNYSALCNEIKQLYVAVTRPRQRLIIYDENQQARQQIQNIWQKLNLVDHFVGTNLEDRNVERFAKQTSKEEWKKQGLKMFRNKYYEQAEKCFEQSQDEQLQTKARAFKIATEGNALTQKYSQYSSSTMKKKDRKQILSQIKIEQKEKFTESAQLFLKLQNYKQAAQCYYSGEMYEEALAIYVEQSMFNEAGEAAYKCEKYAESAEYFLKSLDFIRAVDAFEKAESYDDIFRVLHQLRDHIPVETRSAFLKKYLPIVLNKMTSQIGQLEQVQEAKTKEKKPLVIEESSDEEEDDEEEEVVKPKQEQIQNEVGKEQKQEDEQVQTLEEQSQILQQSEEQQQEKIIELSSQLIKSLPDQSQPSILVKQESMNNNSEDSQSFSVQNTESFQVEQSRAQDSKIISVAGSESFQVENTVNEEEEQNFEHLSHFDPEDQWLKNDNKSIIESIASKKSEQSDFSAFSYAQIYSNPNVQFVKTKTDIFIQDKIMQQIIKYISMFSDEFKYQLYNQRSKSAQLSNKQIDQHEFDYMVDFILDLDLVDISFIYLVLDILEQFQNYKLCIFVCNRYKLADQLGRYLVSIAATYSPIASHSASLNVQYLINGKQRQAQIDKGLVAAFAVHNVFENINPEFITLKFGDTKLTSQNSLGLECYSQMLLLGFWKKTAYQMDVSNSLLVCKLFMDFKNWRFIYYSNLCHQVTNKYIENEQKDRDLAQVQQTTLLLIQKKLDICFSTMVRGVDMLIFSYPRDQQEMEFAIITLEQYYSEIITQLVLNKKAPLTLFYRANTLDTQKTIKVELNPKQNLPKLYSLSEEVLNCFITKTEVPEDVLNKLCDVVLDYKNPHDDLEIYQSVFLLIFYIQYVVHNSGLVKTQSWITLLDVKTYAKLVRCVRFINKVLNTNEDCLQKLQKIVSRSVLFYFKIRQPDNVALLKPYLNSLIIHRSSVIIQSLIENRHNLQLRGNKIVLDDYYFVDIDFEFISAPRASIMFLITKKLSNELNSVGNLRRATFDEYHFDQLYPHEYEDHFENLSVYLYSKQKHTYQLTQNQQVRETTNLSTVDDWIKKEQHEVHQKISENFKMKHGFKVEQMDDQVDVKFLFENNKGALTQQIYFLKNPYLKCLSFESRQYITRCALKKINKQTTDSQKFHCQMVKFIHLMNYADNNHITYQYINNKIEQGQCNKYEPYLQYLECLICKKFNVISDATDIYFSYQETRQDLITPDEQYCQLTYLLLNNMVGYLLSLKKDCQIKIPNRYFIYFDKITQPNEQQYLYETNFHPVSNQDAIARIIEQLAELQKNIPQIYSFKVMLLIYTLVLNLNDVKIAVLNQINYIINDLAAQDEVDQYTQIMKVVNLPQKQRFDALTNSSNAIKLFFAQDVRLYSLNVVNKLTDQTIEAAYQGCLDEWTNLQQRSEKLEKNTRRIIAAFKQQRKGERFFKPYQFGFGEYQLPRKLKTSKYVDIINEFVRVRKILLSTFYSMLLTNSIDFHFISQKLKHLEQKEDQFNCLWTKYHKKQMIKSDFIKNYDEQYHNVTVIIDTLLEWQRSNVTFEQNANKLLERNRKLLALKWMNNKAGLTLQKIQKRKKGLKRQKLQEQKKLLMKLF
ncbi:unnamed protein product (macronuclear) [Paramecium tetraurelia]|uniref:UvrD-like helicase ATP-binding domain-containing protein n=1 Tax=Paramecium tetraurelia TaxID=5888 RepID=A0CVN8_PARTE|nr:uncharacterized protein GSPATT00011023001 [Paramecium tetraurelia]CAK74855.1 unnamed protein product [Paramecium tetraurelia]|eukprot:XP_001442252.1 hypothetical protein (macronuclear) [Paramecium tetraurelia strain d4-2]